MAQKVNCTDVSHSNKVRALHNKYAHNQYLNICNNFRKLQDVLKHTFDELQDQTFQDQCKVLGFH